MEEVVFCKIVDSSSSQSFYLFTTVKENGKDGFHLILSNGREFWEGNISADKIYDQSSSIGIDYNKFTEMTVQALTGKSFPEINFQYQIDRSSEDGKEQSVWFHWKKHIVTDDVRFRLGSTKLSLCRESKSTTTRIFDHCIEKISRLDHKMTSTQNDNERLSQERANALKRLENCVSMKEKLEEDLYSKFLMVLNNKKNEIRKLRQKVEVQDNPKSKETEISESEKEFSDDDNSSTYSAETQKDEVGDPKADDKKPQITNDSLVFTDDSLDEESDNSPPSSKKTKLHFPVTKIDECKKTSKLNSKTDSFFSSSKRKSKLQNMEENIRSRPNFGNKSSSDLNDTNDLLDKI